MGSLNPDSDTKQEFDDSGYVQEDKESPKQLSSDGYRGVTELLDLSDDVLLYILQHCSPMDLKALGFTCNRLANLVLDRTLWQRVDARDRPCGPRRVRWFMAHAIGYNTTAILLSGYAKDIKTDAAGKGVNKSKIDVGASGDGPSVSRASTSKASTSQASISKASTSQASTSQASSSQASTSQASSSQDAETQALAHAIIAQLKKSAKKDSANQASVGASSSQATGEASKHSTIQASQASSNQSVNQPGCEVHVIQGSPSQGSSNQSSMEEESNNQGSSKAENQASASQASKKEESQASSSKEESNAEASTSKASANQAPAEQPPTVQDPPDLPNLVANGVIPPRRPEEERALPPRLYRLTSQSTPRYGNQIPYWPESLLRSDHPASPSPRLTCKGPQVTMTSQALQHLSALCPKLEELALEYCIIDCAAVNLSMFPNYLKKLSFRGSKCYNMEKAFLFKIQDHLPELEVLDLSYCEWVEPACMLPLSKLQNLHTLLMRECPKMSEFVAYASLATRYGFKMLKVLDLRGSPVGDSEVSALGWLPALEQLLLACAQPYEPSLDNPTQTPATELEEWEEDEPEFFRNKRHNHSWLYDEPYYKPKTNNNDTSKGGNESGLERMAAVPIAPEEYTNVYQRYFPEPSPPIAGTSGIRGPNGTPEEYRDAYSTFWTQNPGASAPTAFIISNNRTYSIVHNEDENGNDPNGQAARVDDCTAGPSRDNNEKPRASGSQVDEEPQPGGSHNDEKPRPSRSNYEEPQPPSGSKNDEQPWLSISDLRKTCPSKISDENGNVEGPPPAKKMKRDDACPGSSKSSDDNIPPPSKPSKDDKNNDQHDSDEDDDDDNNDEAPRVRSRQKVAGEATSTSKSQENKKDDDKQPSNSQDAEEVPYIRIRHYPRPIIGQDRSHLNENVNNEQNNNGEALYDVHEPRHRILFVNVSRRHHAMYQLAMPVCTTAEPVDLRTNNVAPNSRNVSSLIYASPISARIDHADLVSDSAIRRFGRAEGESISYVHIGPNGPIPAAEVDPNARPNRSNLRVLIATGYRHITNTSLVHLATSAPNLRFVDFTGTSVTRAGVENFRSLRPDCKVRFSTPEKRDKPK